MRNKYLAIITAVTMLTSVLSGCSNSAVSVAGNTQSTEADTEKTSQTDNPVSEASSKPSLTGNNSSEVSTVSDEGDRTSDIAAADSAADSAASDSAETSNSGDTAEAADADVFCCEFSIDNETYKFPFKYADMEQNGWNYKNDGDQETVKPQQYLIGSRVEKDDMSMSVQPINLTDSEITASDANIGKVALDSYYIKPESHEVKYGTIILGTSTMDDVIAAFGEPSSSYESEKYPTVTYKQDTYVNVKFSFDNTNGGIVDKIEIQNFDEN